jgi:hypothetical protein
MPVHLSAIGNPVVVQMQRVLAGARAPSRHGIVDAFTIASHVPTL